MSTSPVFFDPQRKRWKRIRRVFDVLGVVLTLLLIFFGITVFKGTSLPSVLLAEQKKNYRSLKENEKRHPKKKSTHRRTSLMPTQVALNSGENLRAGFYVTWDAAS